ncbi:MAG: hypothetical protein ACREIC_15730 [Limisphaerales bacterium]
MFPTQFKAKSNSAWQYWTSGAVDESLLKSRQAMANGQSVYINGCQVYTLKMEDGWEWNVLQGWKT